MSAKHFLLQLIFENRLKNKFQAQFLKHRHAIIDKLNSLRQKCNLEKLNFNSPVCENSLYSFI